MAQRNPLTLYCNQCGTLLVGSDSLMLASIPPSLNHVAVRKECEEKVYDRVRKTPNPDPKKSAFCPYRIICRHCDSHVGSVSVIEETTLICFKVEAIHFKRGYEDIRGKKLKNIKDKLIQNGLEVVNVRHIFSVQASSPQTPSEPLVYCDPGQLSLEEIRSLTTDIPRGYQQELFLAALEGNTLVYLPTGSGKTLIAAMLLSCMKRLNPKKLMVFMTDRIPLVYQQSEYIKSQVPDLRVEILAGDIGRFPGDKSRWAATVQALSENKVDLVVMTHQILLNLMADSSPVVRMSDISVLVFDEAHHCLGNHCYNQIMRDFYKVTSNMYKPLVLALTASPAGANTLEATKARLNELLSNLCATARMPEYSTDLELYWNRPETSYEAVPLNSKQQCLQSSVASYVDSLKSFLEYETGCPRALDGLRVLTPNYRGALRKLIERCYGDKSRVKGLALGEHAMHMLCVIEVNNILGCEYAMQCLQDCLESLQEGTSPMEQLKKKMIGFSEELLALQDFVRRLDRVSKLFSSSDRYQYLMQELNTFMHQVQHDSSSRGIVFVKMQATAHKLCQRLRGHSSISEQLNPGFLVGHGAGSLGMNWRGEQEEILKKFRSGEVKLLVSTSVLEEGLDVPVCNMVIRFDSNLSMRALLQSRGRASRRSDSRFIVICSDAKEQVDAFDAIRREQHMDQAMRHQRYYVRSYPQSSAFGCQVSKMPLDLPAVYALNDAFENETPMVDDSAMESECYVASLTVNERAESLASRTKKPKKTFTPEVKITIHNISREERSKQIEQLTEFMQRYFEVKSFPVENSEAFEATFQDKDKIVQEGRCSEVAKFKLEPLKQHTFQSKDAFFTHVVESWCSRPMTLREHSEKLWLGRVETSRSRNSKSVHVVRADAMSVGYFMNQAHYCIHWPFAGNSRLEMIRLAFQHDLRLLCIFCKTSKPFQQLFKFQVHYSEMQEFILVDKPRALSTHDIFISLRHPPRVFKAKSFGPMKNEDDEDDFKDWYFEENEYDFDYELDRSEINGLSSGSEDDEENGRSNDSGGSHGSDDTIDEADFLTSSDVANIEDVVSWERVIEVDDSAETFGLCWTYNFIIPQRTWQEVKDALKSIARFDKRAFFASVRKSVRPLPELEIPQELSFEVKYAVQCVLHSYPFARGRMSIRFASLLGRKPERITLMALGKLVAALERNPFCDPETKLESLLDEIDPKSTGIPKQIVPSHCAMIKRFVITPTRLLFFPPEIMSMNRVLRKFDTNQFLCTNIRDEDFSKLSVAGGPIDVVLARVKRILRMGVLAGGDRFLFLGSSNSQLRNHGCWFVRPNPHPDQIRKWMGDFSKISCVATYMARMGQCFSTSWDAVGIGSNEGATQIMDDDITTPSGSYCFSDGVGKISEPLVRKVARKLAKNFLPSAIQIRFAGFKGVLTLDPSLPENTVAFRPSMRKFESSHQRLEVLQTSRPQAVFLNHQLIMLLSNLGVSDEVFIKLQRDMLDKLAGMLVNERLATQQLTSGCKTGVAYIGLSESGIQLTTEPFFKSLLVALYKDRMQNLLSRARILLPQDKARLMLGVMDETGTLQYGEVFVQYSAVSTDPDRDGEYCRANKIVLTGPVVVTRNPCLHPGDIRQLTAVSAPQLNHLVDCVVFPSRGPRPHPSEMAGGDLDGDLYFVCWKEELLLKRPLFEPMNYEAPPKRTVVGPITDHHMAEFVAEYIRFDQLGVIDNAHKAHADSDKDGVESQICLELAELHSLAVDAPKTGEWPEMPKDAKVTSFPDFMMKPDKPSYPSDKVLGKLFRECRAFKNSLIQGGPYKKHRVAPGLLVPNFQRYLGKAKELYKEYSSQLQTLMNLYGIDTEAELLSGCFQKLHDRLGREKMEIADIVSHVLETVRTNFRSRFFEEFEEDGTRRGPGDSISEEMEKKASAWYYVAYTHQEGSTIGRLHPEGPSEEQFLSFPWVIDDIMLSISQRKPFKNEEGVSTSVTRTVAKFFLEQSESLLEQFIARLNTKNLIDEHISKAAPGLRVALFGSSATMLFRPDSDLDVCVLDPSVVAQRRDLGREEQIALLRKLRSVMRKIFKHARLVETARIPVIPCENLIKRSFSLPKLTGDLAASSNGLLKAIVFSQYIKSYPALLPLLRVLINWGHVAGLSGHGKDALVKSNLLTFLLLIFCVTKRLVRNFDMSYVWCQCLHISLGRVSDDVAYQEWKAVIDSLQSVITSRAAVEHCSNPPLVIGEEEVGDVLLSFFQAYNTILENEIPKTFAILLGVRKLAELLEPEHLCMLTEHMQRAFHLLALHGDVEVLLTLSASQVDRVIFLPEALSYTIAGSERHNAHELSLKTGARVTIRPRVPGSGMGLILQAVGTEAAVASVEHALNAMSTQAVRNRAAIMSVCYVKEAKHMLFEGCLSDDDRVALVPYYGNNHPTHDSMALYVPMMTNPRSGLGRIGAAYTRHEFLTFQEKFLTQVQLIERDFVPSIHGDMEFVVHFGRIYVLNVPKTFTEDTESPTVNVFQTNLQRGYKPRPEVLSVFRESKKRGKVYYRRTQGKAGKGKKQNVGQPEEDNSKKPRKEKSSRSSFFTVVSSDEKVVNFLTQRGFIEVGTEEAYVVEIQSDHEFCVKFDKFLAFVHVGLPKLRWCVVDVKRTWKENTEKHDITELDGVETDVRFGLMTRRVLPRNEIQGTSYEPYCDVIQPQSHPRSSRCPFVTNQEMWKDVALIRHKKSRIYRFEPSKLGVLQSEFRKSLCVQVSDVTEYSRPTKHASAFSKVFRRCELAFKPALPNSWSDTKSWEQFLRDIWAIAFALASVLSE